MTPRPDAGPEHGPGDPEAGPDRHVERPAHRATSVLPNRRISSRPARARALAPLRPFRSVRLAARWYVRASSGAGPWTRPVVPARKRLWAGTVDGSRGFIGAPRLRQLHGLVGGPDLARPVVE